MPLTGTQDIIALLLVRFDRTPHDKFGSIASSETAQSKQTPGGKLLHSGSARIVQFKQFGCKDSLGWQDPREQHKRKFYTSAHKLHGKCRESPPTRSDAGPCTLTS